jgi:predicted Fe-Mo cluster-binding NifX family protein
MRVAVPSEEPGGLDAAVSEHFGHAAAFTLIDIEGEDVQKVEILPNVAHTQGGCMGPVMLLKNAGVDALVAGGMGMRPLMGFQQVGIVVYFREQAQTVSEAVTLFATGQTRQFGPAQTCGGGGGHGGGHGGGGGCQNH